MFLLSWVSLHVVKQGLVNRDETFPLRQSHDAYNHPVRVTNPLVR